MDRSEENNLDFQELNTNEIIDINNEKIHDIIYETSLEIKSYINENRLQLLEKIDYIDFFNLIEDQIEF
jgi:hypothetical protein